MSVSVIDTCSVCGGPVRPDALPGTYRCPGCDWYGSVFPVRINDAGAPLDEALRERSLKTLRQKNFAQVLDRAQAYLPVGATVIDIGAAHGWFLGAARERGWRAIGLEPDAAIAGKTRARGHDVITGFFPHALPPDAKYDAIVFNDVFEHLPDIQAMAAALARHLADDGIVIMSLPVSEGLMFRLSRVASRCGASGPLSRLWQKGMPSPHLSYFSSRSLAQLMARHGFRLAESGVLQSIESDGLYARIRYDGRTGPLKATGLYAAARVVKAVASFFPADVRYFIFGKAADALTKRTP